MLFLLWTPKSFKHDFSVENECVVSFFFKDVFFSFSDSNFSLSSPDPYVKVSLMCEGRRLKKRKTSTKRNTLNPVYNEAIVFDVPPENIDQISLLIAVMDYDRWATTRIILYH